MDALLYFSETTLLWIVSGFFILGISWRICSFIISIIRRRIFSRHSVWHCLITLILVLAPFHRAFLKYPGYVLLRYAFHACLFIVPVWFSGHIDLWEESRFEWYWTPLPDAWADWMTLAVPVGCGLFFLRRIIFKNHIETRLSDCILIVITVLPFLSGYFLTHGTLSDIVFFENYLWYVHVISGEIMLVTIVFLFCRTRLSKKTCVGCAACVENCPTETLQFYDGEAYRHFNYSHYQCIGCGSCVNVCAEMAAGLHHELKPAHLMQIATKAEILKIELKACERCGVYYGPIPQLDKLYRSMHRNEIEINTLGLCPRCKKLGRGIFDLTRGIS